MVNVKTRDRIQNGPGSTLKEAVMKLDMKEIMNETVGATLCTSVCVLVVGYALLSLVTNSLEVLF